MSRKYNLIGLCIRENDRDLPRQLYMTFPVDRGGTGCQSLAVIQANIKSLIVTGDSISLQETDPEEFEKMAYLELKRGSRLSNVLFVHSLGRALVADEAWGFFFPSGKHYHSAREVICALQSSLEENLEILLGADSFSCIRKFSY